VCQTSVAAASVAVSVAAVAAVAAEHDVLLAELK
jgi:hypothetical protein